MHHDHSPRLARAYRARAYRVSEALRERGRNRLAATSITRRFLQHNGTFNLSARLTISNHQVYTPRPKPISPSRTPGEFLSSPNPSPNSHRGPSCTSASQSQRINAYISHSPPPQPSSPIHSRSPPLHRSPHSQRLPYALRRNHRRNRRRMERHRRSRLRLGCGLSIAVFGRCGSWRNVFVMRGGAEGRLRRWYRPRICWGWSRGCVGFVRQGGGSVQERRRYRHGWGHGNRTRTGCSWIIRGIFLRNCS